MKILAFALCTITLAVALAAPAEDPTIIDKEAPMKTLSAAQTQTIRKEVTEQFTGLVAALNQLNAAAWSEHYSQEAFVSAIAGAETYATRRAWVDAITANFATREKQQVTPRTVAVTPLAPDLALLTSQETTEMHLKDGKIGTFQHVFTMIWRKEPTGWKIVHSHESWINEQPE